MSFVAAKLVGGAAADLAGVRAFAPDRRIAVLGDSRVANASTYSGSLDLYWYNDTSFITFARALSGQRVDFDHSRNFGVIGDTVAQILARTDAALAASSAPTWIVLGGTNSIAGGVSATSCITDMSQILSKIKAAGRRAIVVAETPRGDTLWTSQTLTRAQMDEMAKYRTWLRAQVDANCFVVDVWGDLADITVTTGRAVLGRLHDGLHASQNGAYRQAVKLAEIFKQIFPPVQVLPSSNAEYKNASNPNGWYASDQFNSNPMMLGTSGTRTTDTAFITSTGQVATSWGVDIGSASGTGGSLAVTCSKYTDAAGKEWQQIDISGTAPLTNSTGGIPFVHLSQFISAGTYPAGQILEAVSEFEVVSSTGLQGIPLGILARTGFNAARDFHGANIRNDFPSGMTGIMRTPRVTVNATLATYNLSLGHQIFLRGNGTEISSGNLYNGAVNASVRFRCCGLRSV